MSAEALQGLQQQGGTEPQQQPGQGQPAQQGFQQQDGNSLVNEFLGGIPDNVKPLLEPYVKQWDAQVTRKFQELHSKYQPYEQLGDVEQIRQAVAIAQALDENPQEIFNILREELEGGQGAGAPGQPTGGQQPILPGQVPPVGGLPPEIVERLDRTENIVAQLGQMYLEDRQSRDQAQEDAAYEEYLQGLKQQYGEFDEDWVTLQISRGIDGEKAAQMWQQKTQEIINAAQGPNANSGPPVLSGGGVVPHQPLDVKSMDRKDLRNSVAAMLDQVNRQ